MLKDATGSDKPPETWDEVVAIAEKVKAKYGSQVSAFGMDWNWIHRGFLPIMSTYTDKVFTDKGVLNLDDPAAKTALDVMKKLYGYTPASAADALGSRRPSRPAQLPWRSTGRRSSCVQFRPSSRKRT